MKFTESIKPVLLCLSTTLLTFVVVSLLDILIAVFYSRFYSAAAFIVTFGVGGIFAGVLGYMNGISVQGKKKKVTRWILILLLIIIGAIFFFPLATIEGGEYKSAFKAYGITIALSSVFFMKEKIEL